MLGLMVTRGTQDSPLPEQPETLGERLRWLRKQRGLTQVELAEALGCEQTMISSWEVGRTGPTSATLVALARFHQVSAEALASGHHFLEEAQRAVEAFRHKGRAKVASGNAEVSLNPPPFGKVMILDLATGTSHAMDSHDAQMHYLRAVQKGREVWMVMR